MQAVAALPIYTCRIQAMEQCKLSAAAATRSLQQLLRQPARARSKRAVSDGRAAEAWV